MNQNNIDIETTNIKNLYENKFNSIEFFWFLVFLLLSTSLLVTILNGANFFEYSVKTYCLINFAVFISCYIFNLVYLRLYILSLPQIFLLVTFLYTSGLLTLHGFGLSDLSLTLRWYDEFYTLLGIKMIIMAVLSMEAGVCLAIFRKYNEPTIKEAFIVDRFAKPLFKLGIFCFLISVAIITLSTMMGSGFSSMFTSGYEGLTTTLQYSDVRFFLTALSLLLPVSIIIMAAGSRNKRQIRIVYFCALIALMAFFLAGDRGGAFTFLIALAFTLSLIGKKYSYTKILIGAMLALILIPIIRDLRHQPISDMVNYGIEFNFEESPFVRALVETGSSFQTFLGTLIIIPDIENYRYGSTYLHAFTKIFPNLGSWKPPSGEIVGLNAWITSYMNPFGSGLAFLQIAEFYVQFGVVGIFLGFLAMGYFLTKWQKKCESGLSDRRWIAINGCVLCFLLIWIRNDIFNFIRPAMWSIFLILGWSFLTQRFSSKDPVAMD